MHLMTSAEVQCRDSTKIHTQAGPIHRKCKDSICIGKGGEFTAWYTMRCISLLVLCRLLHSLTHAEW